MILLFVHKKHRKLLLRKKKRIKKFEKGFKYIFQSVNTMFTASKKLFEKILELYFSVIVVYPLTKKSIIKV